MASEDRHARSANPAETERAFNTLSGTPLKQVYTPQDQTQVYDEDLGDPGTYPYTRGIHRSMYRGRLWTMRQFSGFGSAADTNERFRFLLEQGQTGLSVAFDVPTLMGLDSDHPLSKGEVGVCGVAIDTLADMESLFSDIPLDAISTSMTINAPAAILLAMYLVTAEKQGASWHDLRGTLQNDILKEYLAQKEWICPPTPAMKLVADTVEFCCQNAPKWNPISISGYHIREAGSTAVQELAFTLADGFAYIDECLARGLTVDDVAPRFSFFFNAHMDFFEEIAKYRAARRIWAKHLRNRYGAADERSLKLRFHTQTAGCSLTAQQPENNVIRTTIEAMAAALGGTQSLHTNALDEAYALPSEQNAKTALRTQQIIARETGLINTADPLGGSFYVEALTDEMEAAAESYFERIEGLGGMVKAIEEGFPQSEIVAAAKNYQNGVETGRHTIVGVNVYAESTDVDIDTLDIDPAIETDQRSRLDAIKENRDNARVDVALSGLKQKADIGENTMPAIVEAVRCYATVGEMVSVLQSVYGTHEESPVY